ncbi:MAG: DUF3857 domain-containing protein [Planctomycetes bacterium]|nr:DUF3857 domain-containing protein [Planctomycetota bacterium]
MFRKYVVPSVVMFVLFMPAGMVAAQDMAALRNYLQQFAEKELLATVDRPETYLHAALELLEQSARLPMENEQKRLALAAAEAFVSSTAKMEDEGVVAHGEYVSLYARISKLAPEGSLKDLASQLYARALAARGNARGAASVMSRQGLLKTFHLVGPFDNERGGAFTRSFGPEAKVSLEETFKGIRHDVSWRAITTGAYDGTVNLCDYVYPNQWTAAYLFTRIEVSRAGQYVLKAASDDGVVIWVDGVKAVADRSRRSMTMDQDTAMLQLSEGTHDILLKTLQEKGAWEIRTRLVPVPGNEARPFSVVDYDGSPRTGTAELLEDTPPADGAAMLDEMLASIYRDVDGKSMYLSLDKSRAKQALGEAGEEIDLGLELLLAMKGIAYWQSKLGGSVRPIDDKDVAVYCFLKSCILKRRAAYDTYMSDNPAKELIARASRLWPSNPAIAYEHALALFPVKEMEAEKNYNPYLKEMKRLAELAPGHTGALGNLTLYYGTIGNDDRAYRYASAIHEESPLKPMFMAMASQGMGWEWEIDPLLEKYADGENTSVFTARMLLKRLHAKCRFDEEYKLLQAVLKKNYTQGSIWIPAFETMLNWGRARDAAALLQIEQALYPESRDVMHAGMLAAESTRDYRKVLSLVEQRIRQCPQDHTLYEDLGRYLSLAGDKEGALEAYKKGLEIEPTYTPIMRYLEVFESPDDYAAPYLVDAANLARGAFDKEPSDGKYPAEVLLDQAVVRVGKDGKASSTIHRVIRLVNPQGVSRFGSFTIGYAAGEQEVKVLAARTYHPDGRVDDAQAAPGRSRSGTGGRVGYTISAPHPNPGDIVEYRVRIEDRKLSFFGNHYEELYLFGETVPVDMSEYVLIVPEAYPISHHVANGKVPLHKRQVHENMVYQWTIKNVPSVVSESGMPSLIEVVPTLYVSKFTDWQEFGKWYWGLVKDQEVASPAIKKQVETVTHDKETTLEKIRAIYHFVTNDIEYVAWEFGVHGFKPYDTGAVLDRKFGDCKDKATLLKIMLAQIGVPAYQALVRSSDTRIKQDMTLPLFRHFNHAICYVPKGEDYPEMWLDGTAQFYPFGMYPTGDADRQSCVIEETRGGVLRTIPPSDPDRDHLSMNVLFTFQAPQGDSLPATAEIKSIARGEAEAIIRHNFDTKPKEILERVYSRRYGKCTAVWHQFPDLSDMYENCDYSYGLQFARMGRKEGANFTVPVFRGFLRPWDYADLVTLDKRTHPLVLGSFIGYEIRVTMEPPQGYTFGKLPENTELDEGGIRFNISFQQAGSTAIMTERLLIDTGRVKPEDYPVFRNNLLLVSRSEKQELLIIPAAGSAAAKEGQP